MRVSQIPNLLGVTLKVKRKYPYLNSTIKRTRGECIWILWVEGERHNVMGMALEGPGALPILFPVPELDG